MVGLALSDSSRPLKRIKRQRSRTKPLVDRGGGGGVVVVVSVCIRPGLRHITLPACWRQIQIRAAHPEDNKLSASLVGQGFAYACLAPAGPAETPETRCSLESQPASQEAGGGGGTNKQTASRANSCRPARAQSTVGLGLPAHRRRVSSLVTGKARIASQRARTTLLSLVQVAPRDDDAELAKQTRADESCERHWPQARATAEESLPVANETRTSKHRAIFVRRDQMTKQANNNNQASCKITNKRHN